MSAAASFLPRYTPAQLEAKRRVEEVRARLGATHNRRQFIYSKDELPKPAPIVVRLPSVMPPVVHTGRRTLKEKAERFLAAVCKQHNVRASDVLGDRRRADLVAARRQYTWLLYRFTKQTLTQIGEMTNRDHTSVIHALRAYAAERPNKRKYPCARFTPAPPALMDAPVLLPRPTGAARKWTEADREKLAELYDAGVKPKVIARELDRSIEGIRHAIRILQDSRV